jgi:hypothetical protein
MTETPGQPTSPTPEQQSNATPEPTPEPTSEPVTEPTPAATNEPTTEPTDESHPIWHWPENRRNRIAASAAIVAGAVAVIVASFTGGFVTGAHAGASGQHQARWGHHTEMSAYPEHAQTGQIWIIPGGETAQGHGYIIAEAG